MKHPERPVGFAARLRRVLWGLCAVIRGGHARLRPIPAAVSFGNAEVTESRACLFTGHRARAAAGEFASPGPADPGRKALPVAERCHRTCAREQSRSGDRPLQRPHCQYRCFAYAGGRILPRCQYGSRAGHSRRRRGGPGLGSSGGRCGRHDRRRGRCGFGGLRPGAIHPRYGHRGFLL